MGRHANGARVRSKTPKTTGTVFIITASLTVLQFPFPGILAALQRAPPVVSSGEWWRLITPIFINRADWMEIAVNGLALIVVGVIVERRWSAGRWLVFYLAGGLVGELAGLAWRPYGAGPSVAVCGLLGALAAWLLWRLTCWRARAGGAILIAAGLALTVMRNLHGPPLLAGACIAGVMLWRETVDRRP